MSNKILRFEELSLNAFPSLSTELYDGWVLRYSNGYTYRGNCVNPLYPSSIDLETKIKHCEDMYFSKSLPCVFKITQNTKEKLDELLAIKNYKLEKEVNIMGLNLSDINFEEHEDVSVFYSLDESWLNDFMYLNDTYKEPIKSTAKKMLNRISTQVFCAAIYDSSKMIACGLGVLEDHILGLYDIRVLKEYRRKGFGTKICKKLINESINYGAHSSYLQVASTNNPAIQMYKSLGFKKLYNYWYRVKNN